MQPNLKYTEGQETKLKRGIVGLSIKHQFEATMWILISNFIVEVNKNLPRARLINLQMSAIVHLVFKTFLGYLMIFCITIL